MILRYPRGSRTVCCSAFIGSFLILLSITASAQEQRPVARLISTASTPDYNRPRRVSAAHVTGVPTQPVFEATKSPSLDQATEIERRAFELTNEFRVKHGLNQLKWDAELCRMARAHSEKMGRRGFFSHETPEGERLRDRARAIGIQRFRVIAENIAYNQGFDDPGAFVVERWTKSGGHRANMIYVGFEAAAVGVFVAPDGTVYFTQTFIAR